MNCKIEDCGKHANRKGHQLCEAHYGRFRRNGTFDVRPPVVESSHSGGYILDHVDGHPLCTPGGGNVVFQHRRIYYDIHGVGPFQCNWCAERITWADLHVDHLNEDKKDNAPDNLVVSCGVCNQQRGMWKSVAKSKHNGLIITFNGESYCQVDWARKIGITVQSLVWRLNHGWPIERALTESKGRTGPAVDPESRSQQWMNSKLAAPMELSGNTLQVLGLGANISA